MLLRRVPLSSCKRTNHQGFSLSEVTWTLVLGAVVLSIILITLGRERSTAEQHRAKSHLEYLRGHVHLTLEEMVSLDDAPREFFRTHVLVGPKAEKNEIPAFGDRTLSDLAKWLPEGTFLCPDPWGFPYFVHAQSKDGRETLWVSSLGPDGILDFENEPDLSIQVLWPRRPE